MRQVGVAEQQAREVDRHERAPTDHPGDARDRQDVLLDRVGFIVSGMQFCLSLGQLPEVRAALAGGAQSVLRANYS